MPGGITIMTVTTLDNRKVDINDDNAGTVLSPIDDQRLVPYLDNPFVKGIHGNRIFYKKEFYIAMYKLITDEKKTYVEAYEHLGFKVSDLGESRAQQAGKNAVERAKTGTLFAVSPCAYDGSIPLDKMPELDAQEEIAMLKARVIYLETMNEIQKKIPFILAESCMSSKRSSQR